MVYGCYKLSANIVYAYGYVYVYGSGVQYVAFMDCVKLIAQHAKNAYLWMMIAHYGRELANSIIQNTPFIGYESLH
jgi:hypothetical protein